MSRKPRRLPTRLESFMQLAEISDSLDNAKDRMVKGTEDARRELAGVLAKEAAEAAQRGTLPTWAAETTEGPPALEQAVLWQLQAYYDDGRQQVAGELYRQARGEPATAGETRELPRRVRAAEEPRKEPVIGTVDIPAALAALAFAGAMTVLTAMRAAALQAAMRPNAPAGSALEGAAFDAAFVAGEASALRVSASVHDAVNLGRAFGAQENADRIEDAVYSAILDSGTCSECEAMDGQQTTDLEEAYGWTPNPSCAGGDRCRCLTVFELAR